MVHRSTTTALTRLGFAEGITRTCVQWVNVRGARPCAPYWNVWFGHNAFCRFATREWDRHLAGQREKGMTGKMPVLLSVATADAVMHLYQLSWRKEPQRSMKKALVQDWRHGCAKLIRARTSLTARPWHQTWNPSPRAGGAILGLVPRLCLGMPAGRLRLPHYFEMTRLSWQSPEGVGSQAEPWEPEANTSELGGHPASRWTATTSW